MKTTTVTIESSKTKKLELSKETLRNLRLKSGLQTGCGIRETNICPPAP